MDNSKLLSLIQFFIKFITFNHRKNTTNFIIIIYNHINLLKITRSLIQITDELKDFFTSYLLEKKSRLNGVYALRLYELLIKWKSLKKTHVSVR
ncbi:RepB family plasmid replication initiator protein [Acinetobacter sp. ANC 4654]|uniref:RepB family plasmid replication initiator protein n=1 Tax=Acinetobacter sp. ANC 4654 TaxID=1977872 RepID=UPI001D17BB82|nr:RepB family plasmid replication initiator protein [Acinetobacter sp. ANC 4654]